MERREVTVRLDEQEFNQFDDVCHTRRVKKQQALIEAIAVWMRGSEPPRSSLLDQAPAPEPSEWHRKLTEILKSGDQATIAAVTQSIELFHDRLRPARRRRAV